jgi:hypothetical protein
MSQRQGGCQCGALRYRIEAEPVALVACHCTECQRQSGSAFGMSLVVPQQAFRMLSGEPRIFTRKAASGREVACAFCGECGNRIYHEPKYRQETLNVKPGTLDDTSWLSPALHVWTRSKQPWVPLPEGVRCLEGQP